MNNAYILIKGYLKAMICSNCTLGNIQSQEGLTYLAQYQTENLLNKGASKLLTSL